MLLFCSELPSAAARPQPARRHLKVRLHGQEGDQQAAQTEGEEERVEGRVEGGAQQRWKVGGGSCIEETERRVQIEASCSSGLCCRAGRTFLFPHTLDKFHFSLWNLNSPFVL